MRDRDREREREGERERERESESERERGWRKGEIRASLSVIAEIRYSFLAEVALTADSW